MGGTSFSFARYDVYGDICSTFSNGRGAELCRLTRVAAEWLELYDDKYQSWYATTPVPEVLMSGRTQ